MQWIKNIAGQGKIQSSLYDRWKRGWSGKKTVPPELRFGSTLSFSLALLAQEDLFEIWVFFIFRAFRGLYGVNCIIFLDLIQKFVLDTQRNRSTSYRQNARATSVTILTSLLRLVVLETSVKKGLSYILYQIAAIDKKVTCLPIITNCW